MKRPAFFLVGVIAVLTARMPLWAQLPAASLGAPEAWPLSPPPLYYPPPPRFVPPPDHYPPESPPNGVRTTSYQQLPAVPADPIVTSSSAPQTVEPILGPPTSNTVTGPVAGASIYALRPFYENNTAYAKTTGLGGPTPQTTSTNFGWNMEPAYAIWAGYTWAEGFGLRARWFHLDASSNTMNTTLGSPGATTTNITASPNLPALPLPAGAAVFGSPGLLLNSGLGQDSLTFSSTLRIDAIDTEATWTCDLGNWKLIAGAGGRYLHMDQNYQAHLSNRLGDGVTSETQFLSFDHNFDGAGPVVDLQVNWKIGGSNFSIYGLGRGSLLVGKSTQFTSYAQAVNDPKGLTNGGVFPVVTFISPSVLNSTDTVMPTIELELGIEYGRDWGRTHIFMRSAVVNQTYFGAGNATRVDTNLSMFGVQFSAGINY